MLKFLSSRESGLDDPLIFRRAETTRRLFCLDLSRHRDVERVHTGGINSLDIDPIENRYLLSGASNSLIAINDLENFSGDVKYTCKTVCSVGRSNRHLHKKSVETVSWYPLDTGMFLTSGSDGLLKIWDTNTLVPADEHQFNGIIYNHHMSPIATKHSLVAIGCYSSAVKLVDLKSGSASHTLKGHKKSVMCVKWSTKDEFILASGSMDNQCLIWDIRKAKGAMMSLNQYNGDQVSHYTEANTAHNGNVNGLFFTGDGLHLVTCGTDNRIHLWNTTTGRNTLVNYGKVNNEVKRTVQFTVSYNSLPDLIYMPTGSDIDEFDIFQGKQIDTLRGHFTKVNCCIFHSQLQEMYSGGNDRNILVWVPDSDSAYDEHVQLQRTSKQKESTVINIAADSWSSDEDD